MADGAQFTAEIRGADWAKDPLSGRKVELLFNDLFTKIAGNVSMREIMHDAVANEKSLDGQLSLPQALYTEVRHRRRSMGQLNSCTRSATD